MFFWLKSISIYVPEVAGQSKLYLLTINYKLVQQMKNSQINSKKISHWKHA